MKGLSIVLLSIAIFILNGCGSRETLAEVDFQQSKVGLEYIPDRSLEGYNEKYHPFFQPAGSASKKYLFNPDDGFLFATFPKNQKLLEGLDVVVVDTIPRTYEKYDRTIANTTLYIDPKLVDRESFETLSRFVTECYSKPDNDNQMLRWLNYGYNLGENRDSLFVEKTIYALVYVDVSTLEPRYASNDGKKFLKVGVDEIIYFKDDSETSPSWLYTGRLTDSVFHYWAGRSELVDEFGEYERAGVKFKSLWKEKVKED